MGPEDCEVSVSKEDLAELKKHCKEIGEILDRYPYSNGPTDYFYTSMMRVKDHYDDLVEWVNILDVK